MNTKYFSAHAKQRLKERTSLETSALSKILDSKRFISVGREEALNREHCLFYDVNKKSFFVVIRDIVFGTLITVLPIEYYVNLANPIDEKFFHQARALMETPPKEKVEKPKVIHPDHKVNLNIIAHCINFENRQLTKVILRLDAKEYRHSVDNVTKDKSVMDSIIQNLRELEPTVKEIFAVSGRVGSKGELVELRDLKF